MNRYLYKHISEYLELKTKCPKHSDCWKWEESKYLGTHCRFHVCKYISVRDLIKEKIRDINIDIQKLENNKQELIKINEDI